MKKLLIIVASLLISSTVSAVTTATDRIKDFGGQIFIDASTRITGDLQLDKWLDLTSISTPTTPLLYHSRTWLDGPNRRVCTIFDNSTQTCFSAASGIGTLTSLTPGLSLTGGGTAGAITIAVSTPTAYIWEATGLTAKNALGNNVDLRISQTSANDWVFRSPASATRLDIIDNGPETVMTLYNGGRVDFLNYLNFKSTGVYITNQNNQQLFFSSGTTMMVGPRITPYTAPQLDYNTSFGYYAMNSCISGAANDQTKCSDTTAIGMSTLGNLTGGTDNTGLGTDTLLLVTTGYYNTGLGSHALSRMDHGEYNTCVGVACQGNAVGPFHDNVGMGVDTLFNAGNGANYNSIVGNYGFANLSTGSYNTGMGYYNGVNIGLSADGGSSLNTVIGYQAGYGPTTARGLSILGAQDSSCGSATMRDAIGIGHNACPTTSNTAQIGTTNGGGAEVLLLVSSASVNEITAKDFKSGASNPASAGTVRLANTELLEWRNAANNGNIIMSVNASDQFTFDHLGVFGPTSNQLVLGGNGGANFNTINSVTPAASRTLSIQDPGGNANFVMSEGAQNIAGAKTLTSSFSVTSTAGEYINYESSVGSATLRNVASGTQCLHADSSGHITGTGSDCASASSVSLTSTNTWSGGNTFQSSSTFVGQVKVGSNLFPKVRSRQVFTSGKATYTAPAGVLYLNVRMVGAGGGGQGSGSASRGAGGTGGTTYFGVSLSSATGGSGGTDAQSAPGGATVGTCDIAITGGNAGGASAGRDAYGGSSAFGGNGSGGVTGGAGSAGSLNSGGGGGGGGGDNSTITRGSGGGAGGYCEFLITSPNSNYVYGVGTAGTAGTAGTGGQAGGLGAAGIIIVDEFYF